MTSFGVVSIATGSKYRMYWTNQVRSFKETCPDFSEIQFYLLTDNPNEMIKLSKDLNMRLKVFEIPSYGWPEATLLRYREILKIKMSLSEEVLIYLDADMLVRQDFFKSIESNAWLGGIALVAHPGFWRPKDCLKLNFYLASPKSLISDTFNFLRFGGLGSWETRRASAAFVSRRKRDLYVCGGTWMGLRDEFLRMVEVCASSVDSDLSFGIVAKWHDESHLNKWKSLNTATILNPSFCFDPTYPQLKDLPEYIRAVRK
jgi:hypothetical protein